MIERQVGTDFARPRKDWFHDGFGDCFSITFNINAEMYSGMGSSGIWSLLASVYHDQNSCQVCLVCNKPLFWCKDWKWGTRKCAGLSPGFCSLCKQKVGDCLPPWKSQPVHLYNRMTGWEDSQSQAVFGWRPGGTVNAATVITSGLQADAVEWLEYGRFRGEWIHVYVRLSPFAVHLKLSQHC